jgi:hypothetical protein
MIIPVLNFGSVDSPGFIEQCSLCILLGCNLLEHDCGKDESDNLDYANGDCAASDGVERVVECVDNGRLAW